MSEHMIVQAKLATGLCFEVEASSGHHVTLDADEQHGGQNTGFRPMEMLLIGLAGCMGMDMIAILRKKRQQVTAYEIRVEAIRALEHPQVFVTIALTHTISGHALQSEAIARALQLAEERYCSVETMLGKAAQITHAFHIIDAAKTQAIIPASSQALTTP